MAHQNDIFELHYKRINGTPKQYMTPNGTPKYDMIYLNCTPKKLMAHRNME